LHRPCALSSALHYRLVMTALGHPPTHITTITITTYHSSHAIPPFTPLAHHTHTYTNSKYHTYLITSVHTCITSAHTCITSAHTCIVSACHISHHYLGLALRKPFTAITCPYFTRSTWSHIFRLLTSAANCFRFGHNNKNGGVRQKPCETKGA
jgi:hypothetical protein